MKKYYVILNDKIKGPYNTLELKENNINFTAAESTSNDLAQITSQLQQNKSNRPFVIFIIAFVIFLGFALLYYLF